MQNELTEKEMLATIVSSIRAKLTVDAIKGNSTADTGNRFLCQMRAAGVPDMFARLVIMEALAAV